MDTPQRIYAKRKKPDASLCLVWFVYIKLTIKCIVAERDRLGLGLEAGLDYKQAGGEF